MGSVFVGRQGVAGWIGQMLIIKDGGFAFQVTVPL